jgi:hypothetical protein
MKEVELTFVNIFGEPVALDPKRHAKPKRPKKEQPESYHNGWRVQGIPPGALQEAHKSHLAEAEYQRQQGKESKAWDEQHWLMNAKRKALRSKPYELESAAAACKRLAQAAGWLRVEIVELKKEAA